MVVVFYHPPPRVNSQGMTTREVLRQIDYVGGILSVGGMLMFMMGMVSDKKFPLSSRTSSKNHLADCAVFLFSSNGVDIK